MLDKLIEDGEKMKSVSLHQSEFTPGGYMKGQEYEMWIAKCVIFLEREYTGQTLTKRFLEASERAVGNGVEHFDKMMGILKAYKEMF